MLEFEYLLVRIRKMYTQGMDLKAEHSSAVVDLSKNEDLEIQSVLTLEGHTKVLLFYQRSPSEWTIVTPRHIAWKLGTVFSCERLVDIKHVSGMCDLHQQSRRAPYVTIRLCLIMKDERHLHVPYEPGNPMYGLQHVLGFLLKIQ